MRSLNSASLVIGDCKALPVRMRPVTREVRELQTAIEYQQQGHATALVHKVCAEADDAGITLVLVPQPFGDIALSKAQLAGWYARRFGFVTLPGGALMARAPGSTPRYLTPVAVGVDALFATAAAAL